MVQIRLQEGQIVEVDGAHQDQATMNSKEWVSLGSSKSVDFYLELYSTYQNDQERNLKGNASLSFSPIASSTHCTFIMEDVCSKQTLITKLVS
jgi:hypothetical protein